MESGRADGEGAGVRGFRSTRAPLKDSTTPARLVSHNAARCSPKQMVKRSWPALYGDRERHARAASAWAKVYKLMTGRSPE